MDSVQLGHLIGSTVNQLVVLAAADGLAKRQCL